jgi:hypothetical protein
MKMHDKEGGVFRMTLLEVTAKSLNILMILGIFFLPLFVSVAFYYLILIV